MNKLLLSILTVAALVINVQAGENKDGSKGMKNPRAVPMNQATILQDGKNKKYCPICGMTLPMFYKTNHAAKHNEKNHQYCSIVCAVEDSLMNNKKLTDFKVVDNTTLKFIDSKDAYFVVGSKMPGTMSVVSKYAFGTKEAANKLVAKKGGKVMKFDELYTLVVKSQAKDIKATKKRQAKAAKKGGMIYKKMCKKTDKRFSSVADAKSFLVSSKICGNIKGKKHQAVALFLSNK
ncbi:MAG: nitrous oxide reductase accessory protein NosL [Campylobacterota bacterium]|nr:nitrous oxide reductase accessory protein NosL [Campylobacterota bacterium]